MFFSFATARRSISIRSCLVGRKPARRPELVIGHDGFPTLDSIRVMLAALPVIA